MWMQFFDNRSDVSIKDIRCHYIPISLSSFIDNAALQKRSVISNMIDKVLNEYSNLASEVVSARKSGNNEADVKKFVNDSMKYCDNSLVALFIPGFEGKIDKLLGSDLNKLIDTKNAFDKWEKSVKRIDGSNQNNCKPLFKYIP
jgi:hypothetical protein